MVKKKSSSNNGGKPKRKHGVKNGKSGEKSSLSLHHLDGVNGKIGIGFVICVIIVLSSIIWKFVVQNDLNWLNTTKRQFVNQLIINLDSPLKSLVHVTCENGNYGEDVLHTKERTLVSGKMLEKHWRLFEIPRDKQIWTLDAFRDGFVKNKLIGARHSNTDAFLVEQAFIAAYLAMLIKRNIAIQPTFANHQQQFSSFYLDILPTYEDYESHHPVTFDLKELNSLYGAHTQTYFLVLKRKEEIESEYKAFVRISSEFGVSISYKDYVAAPLNVQARGFEAGPLTAFQL
jgi:hypothetical protein